MLLLESDEELIDLNNVTDDPDLKPIVSALENTGVDRIILVSKVATRERQSMRSVDAIFHDKTPITQILSLLSSTPFTVR